MSWKSGVSGAWTVAADCSTGAVPGAADDTTIAVAGSYTVALSTNELTGGTAQGTLDVTGGTLADLTGEPSISAATQLFFIS